MLPKQKDLLEEFGVSKPSIREALRVLEAESLITVRRGNVGGAVVHMPAAASAARTLGMVLGSQNVSLRDLGIALRLIEPVCASLCATRADRNDVVVPALREVQSQAKDTTDKLLATRLARRFHEILVTKCGNETLITTVGALEALWSSHEQEWAEAVESAGELPDQRIASHRHHDQIIKLIAKGDADGAAKALRSHLESSIFFQVSGAKDDLIRPDSLQSIGWG